MQNDITDLKLILFLMILIWGLRLGIYLFIRINKIKKDDRFDEIRTNPIRFLSFWVLQGITVFVALYPALYFFQLMAGIPSPAVPGGILIIGDRFTIPTLSLFGFFVWLIGISIEAIADQQKFAFKNNSINKGKWVNIGLWKYSRHPNYLGEILCWVGIYIYTFPSLPYIVRILGLLSPLSIITLLLFVSGIPKLEEKADKKWGSNKDYQEYKKKTAVLIPYIY